jgi:hypothetical protein
MTRTIAEKVVFRPAQPVDSEAILAINQAGYPGVVRLTPVELTTLLATAPFFYVAQTAAPVIGYLIAFSAQDAYDGVEFGWFRQHYSDFLYIDQLAVAEPARRARVGMQFYQWAQQVARQHGLSSLVCEVNLEPPNPISLKFHAHHGFIKVGTMATPDGRRVSLQRKSLS